MKALIIFILSVLINSGSSFKSELENYLKKNLSGYTDYKYEILQMPESYKKIKLLNPDDFNLSGNMIYVPVRVVNKSGRIFRSILSVRLKLYKDVVVAVKQINKKENLIESDFALEKKDITKISGTPLYSLKDINSFRSIVSIRPGDVIIKQMIQQIPVVNIGDRLHAEYTYGNVVVTMDVYARQEGVVGQVISVITSDKKFFKAKIINSKNVIIIE